MLPYYTPVLISTVSLVLVWVGNARAERVAVLWATLLSVTIIGLRGNVDIDYQGYLDEYLAIPLKFDFDAVRLQYGEILYNLLSGVFRTMGFQYAGLLFVMASFALGIKAFLMLKLCKAPFTALAIYVCIAFIETEMITVRWALASSLLLLSVYLVYSRKFLPAIGTYLGAVGFHSFAAIYVLVVPLLFARRDRTLYGVTLGALVAGLFLPMAEINQLFLLADGDGYSLQKMQRYTQDGMNVIGLFSVLKVLFLLVIWKGADVLGRPGEWRASPAVRNMLRPAVAFLAVSLLFVKYKVFYYRAAVFVDFYLILLAANAVQDAFRTNRKILIFSTVLLMFIVWSIMDVRNHAASGYIRNYELAPLF